MRKRCYFGLLLTIGTAALLVSPAIAEVKVTWHREADPARYETFELVSSAERPGVATVLGKSTERILRIAIEDQLQTMGYARRTAGAVPDFRVQYDAAAARELIREAPQQRLPPFDPYDWVAPQFEALRESFLRGTLILTVRDGATDEPVWCGWTTRPLQLRKLERQAEKLVRRILRAYPRRGERPEVRP